MSLCSCNDRSVHTAAFIGCSIVRDYDLVFAGLFACLRRVFIILCNDCWEYLSLKLTRPVVCGATGNVFYFLTVALVRLEFSLCCVCVGMIFRC